MIHAAKLNPTTYIRRILRACPRLRAFLDLSACRVFTVRQQCAWALLWAGLGASAAVVGQASGVESAVVHRAAPQIVVERFKSDYSVARVEFAQAWCHVVIYHGTGAFAIQC